MNWFRQNPFLGVFSVVGGLCAIAAAWFLWSSKSAFSEAHDKFDANAAELNRLQSMVPLPNESNLRKLKAQAQDYTEAVAKLKAELKTHMLPVVPMAPNEFQAHLRQVILGLAEKAKANKVKLPENFYGGFDEFASGLPNTAATPLLGQQLAQVELVMNILIDAHIDSLTAFRRVPLAEERNAPAATPPPNPGKKPGATESEAKMIERSVVEATFTSTPTAARKVLNQIASATGQFYIIRTLYIANEKDKGPPRDVAPGAPGVAPAGTDLNGPGPVAKPAASPALSFIVGNEHVTTSAKIEMLRFTF